MSAFELYLVIKLDSIINLMTWFMIPSFILMIAALLYWIILWVIPHAYNTTDDYGQTPSDEEVQKVKRICANLHKTAWIILVVAFPIWLVSRCAVSLIPTTKEMAIIYVVPKVINNEEIASIPPKLARLASDWLDELTPEKIRAAVHETDSGKK